MVRRAMSERIRIVPCTHNTFLDRSFFDVGSRESNMLCRHISDRMKRCKKSLKGQAVIDHGRNVTNCFRLP